jgi:glycosyltransferase involved in cell wall biosynthesis
LILAGAGPEETALKVLCRELGLDKAVCFAGQVDQPYKYFASTTLFVLPSRHEGMPNALLEAAAAGLPLAVMPASGGVVDLLHARNGAWVASEITAAALAVTIITALETVRSGQRFSHSFFASRAGVARHVSLEQDTEILSRQFLDQR